MTFGQYNVLMAIWACGSNGATADEVEVALGLASLGGRISDLKSGGYIRETGQSRRTRRGRPAAVHVAIPFEPYVRIEGLTPEELREAVRTVPQGSLRLWLLGKAQENPWGLTGFMLPTPLYQQMVEPSEKGETTLTPRPKTGTGIQGMGPTHHLLGDEVLFHAWRAFAAEFGDVTLQTHLDHMAAIAQNEMEASDEDIRQFYAGGAKCQEIVLAHLEDLRKRWFDLTVLTRGYIDASRTMGGLGDPTRVDLHTGPGYNGTTARGGDTWSR